jgi:hypothetical protein
VCARMCVCVGDKQGRALKGELAHTLAHGEPVSVGREESRVFSGPDARLQGHHEKGKGNEDEKIPPKLT